MNEPDPAKLAAVRRSLRMIPPDELVGMIGSDEEEPPMPEGPTPKEVDQALKIQRLETDRAMVDMEGRIEKRFVAVEKGLGSMEIRFEERFKALDWKMNLIIGGILALLVSSVLGPALRPQSQPSPQQPIVIQVPAPAVQAPVKPPAAPVGK